MEYFSGKIFKVTKHIFLKSRMNRLLTVLIFTQEWLTYMTRKALYVTTGLISM